MRISLNLFEEHREKGLIQRSSHNNLPLYIWNYTPKTQYGRLWDDITIKCRALVTDHQGNVIAKSFDKFFNIEELDHVPQEDFEVYEKLDGSLIVVFYYENNLVVASKGSFHSEHSDYAKEVIKKYDISCLEKDKSYSFELIAPWNKIVCDYGDQEDLILLAKFDVFGNEYSICEYSNCLPVVKQAHFSNLNDIKSSISKEKEGYVVKFSSGQRLKIKGDNYVFMHRIISNLSEKLLFKLLAEEKIEELDETIQSLPDELHSWATKFREKLNLEFYEVLTQCKKSFKTFPSRKEAAAHFLKQEHPSVLFAMLDNQDFSPIIWKIVGSKNELR